MEQKTLTDPEDTLPYAVQMVVEPVVHEEKASIIRRYYEDLSNGERLHSRERRDKEQANNQL